MRGKRNNEDWVKEKLFKSDNIYFGVIFMSESPQHLLGCSWMCEQQEMRLPQVAAVIGPYTQWQHSPYPGCFHWGCEVWLIISLILKKRFRGFLHQTCNNAESKLVLCSWGFYLWSCLRLILFWSDRKQQKMELRGLFRPLSEDCSLVLHLAASSETWDSVMYFCNPKWIAEFSLHWNSYGDI